MPEIDVTVDGSTPNKTTLAAADRHPVVNSEVVPNQRAEILHSDLVAAFLAEIGGGVVSGAQGFGDNYVITPSIASNNLTVALKTIAGADPSLSGKISFRIGNTKRELTAALSVTVNAGASSGAGTFNAGSAELNTKDIQLFVYVGWRASDSSLFILLSRIPFARTMADFSGTAANEKYGAYSGAAPLSTDNVENIGRINVQNSGSASYNWSIPTSVVVNRPIYETDWLTWQPVFGANYTSVTTTRARYQLGNRKLSYSCRFVGTSGGGATSHTATLPFDVKDSANSPAVGGQLWSDGGGSGIGGQYVVAGSPDLLTIIKYNVAAYANGASCALNPTGFYEIE